MEPSIKPKVFVREATGLVREISKLDAFFANFSYMSVVYGILAYTTAPYLFPGSDPVTATYYATFFSIFVGTMYTLFTWAMPRSGGDYIYVSRALHPVAGFLASFLLTFWFMFYNGISVNWVTTLAISPSLLVIGTIAGDKSLIALANVLTQPQNVLIIGLVITAFYAGLMLMGVRTLFRLNNIIVAIAIVGIGLTIWLLATSTNAGFAHSFDKFASYDGIITAAHQGGYSPVGAAPLLATLGVMPFIWGSTGFGVASASVGGEMKEVKMNAFYAQLVSVFVVGGILAVLGTLSIRVFGYDFLGSISTLSYSGSSVYPFSVPPFFNLFTSILTDNTILLWLLAIGYIAAIIIPIPVVFLVATRNIFAWSFDRVLPAKFSSINERTHAPVYAVIVVTIATVIGLVVYTYVPPTMLSFAAGAGMIESFAFIIVSIAAIVFPFRQKTLYKNSPAKIEIGKIPLISIAGVMSFIFVTMIFYFYSSNPLYGSNIPVVWEAMAVTVILPLVIFIASYYYQKKQGLNLMLVFKQIPPE